MEFFNVWIRNGLVFVRPCVDDVRFKVYENDVWVASGLDDDGVLVTLQERKPNTILTIEYLFENKLGREHFPLISYYAIRERNYQAGDILVASDNLKSELTGYMGHSALVINENELIESPGLGPAIIRSSIKQFLDKHPVHAQFRPVQSEVGEKVAQYAIEYYQKYKLNVEKGIHKPTFSFDLSQELDDPWDKIYCSKLVWICYHFGANYTFENDHLWFSPEDLYHQLLENQDFELVYQHQNVKFLIDT
ncbi:hypothetical protein SAMN04487943_10370 [Gracilibacillus orientalis]|uniref:Permuted papain-like amidase enzyme, YaeF/YiiX, C92 family n=1 Tax=Gracilibacillus orientalis TaxID=334253 RepID=A0A1I4JP89_9BACI|nr:hypothetical protein [Gracilibacillus orientalis]SFL68017.1 hypothetical protein SAMN04487943_10370 [Gracilibacillus orientalis]